MRPESEGFPGGIILTPSEMNIRLFLLVAASVCGFGAGPVFAQQDLKIGIVDMKRIFKEYHKTKEAEKKVNEDKTAAKKQIDNQVAKHRELMNEYTEARKVMADKLVSEQLRQEKGRQAQNLEQELRSLEREIDEFRRRREAQLTEQVARMRVGLLDDIRRIVEEKSKRDSYDLVFDKSGMSPTGVPFLLHSKAAVEFTDEILAEINKNAPKEPAEAK